MKVLLLSPHPDDAELGAGGTIAKFIEQGHEIAWVVFSICEESIPKDRFPSNVLEKEFIELADFLKIKNFHIYKFSVRNFNFYRQEILDILIELKKEFKPDIVFTTSSYDYHQDHQTLHLETVRAFKDSASILGYELPWNNLKFSSSFFSKLEKRHIDQKYEMMKIYQSQIEIGRKYFSKEYISALAMTRGLQCSSDYAETFEVIKWIL